MKSYLLDLDNFGLGEPSSIYESKTGESSSSEPAERLILKLFYESLSMSHEYG